jgi:hypothetical protein
MPSQSTSPKKQRLTLAQLAAYDDILTDALVDHVSHYSSETREIVRSYLFAGLLLDEHSKEQDRISFFTRNSGGRRHINSSEKRYRRERCGKSRGANAGFTWPPEVL